MDHQGFPSINIFKGTVCPLKSPLTWLSSRAIDLRLRGRSLPKYMFRLMDKRPLDRNT